MLQMDVSSAVVSCLGSKVMCSAFADRRLVEIIRNNENMFVARGNNTSLTGLETAKLLALSWTRTLSTFKSYSGGFYIYVLTDGK